MSSPTSSLSTTTIKEPGRLRRRLRQLVRGRSNSPPRVRTQVLSGHEIHIRSDRGDNLYLDGSLRLETYVNADGSTGMTKVTGCVMMSPAESLPQHRIDQVQNEFGRAFGVELAGPSVRVATRSASSTPLRVYGGPSQTKVVPAKAITVRPDNSTLDWLTDLLINAGGGIFSTLASACHSGSEVLYDTGSTIVSGIIDACSYSAGATVDVATSAASAVHHVCLSGLGSVVDVATSSFGGGGTDWGSSNSGWSGGSSGD